MNLSHLVVAISSRALFDLEYCHAVYLNEGEEAYTRYQIDNEHIPLEVGDAFPFVKKLLALNESQDNRRVEVVLLSRNSADTGLRVFNSIRHHELDITRAVFTRGANPYCYLKDFGAHLFLTTSADDVRAALNMGVPAAALLPSVADSDSSTSQIRIAFDGDAVLFSDEPERVYQQRGLDAFNQNEHSERQRPLPGGPFKPFLSALHRLQQAYPDGSCPIRTALVTARSAPAHERVIRTLRSWEIRIDEALFLGGMKKGPFLKSFGADIFFDDHAAHCESALEHTVASGHVPYGIKNEPSLVYMDET